MTLIPATVHNFTAELQNFSLATKRTMIDVTREQLRLACREAMEFTAPMKKGGGGGLLAGSRTVGERAVTLDIKRIFIPSDSKVRGVPVLLKNIINTVKRDNSSEFTNLRSKLASKQIGTLSRILQEIVLDPDEKRALAKAKNLFARRGFNGGVKVVGTATDLRAVHSQQKGRVGGRWPRGKRHVEHYYATEAQIAAYIAKRIPKVGFVKAGWGEAQMKIPGTAGKFSAAWVMEDISGSGFYAETQSPDGAVSATIANRIGNINRLSDSSGMPGIVLGLRKRNMQAKVKALLAKYGQAHFKK